MADYKEVRVEHLYLKVPNTDRLRKNAAGRHKHLLASGWREVERRPEIDNIAVKYERTGPIPLKLRLPKGSQEQVRLERRPRQGGQFGARGGPRGRR